MSAFASRRTLGLSLVALMWSLSAAIVTAEAMPPPERDGLRAFLESDGKPELSGVITLRGALAAALVGNPTLQVFSVEIRAREARALQAGVLPNPELALEVENLGAGGEPFERTETTLSLAQLVELGGKRTRRRRVANLERDLAGWDYETQRALVLTEVTRAFVTALAAQERLVLAEELVGIAEQSLSTVSTQVRAGAVSPLEEDRARVALERSRLEKVALEHDLAATRAELAATWGSGRVTFSALRGDLRTVEAPPPLESLLAHVDANPDLARWAVELEQRRAALRLEETRRVPDVTIGVGARRFAEDDTNAAVLELSVPLPLFDRNQGGVAEARHRLTKAGAEQWAAETSVRSALTKAYESLHAAFDQVTILRDGIIPRATTVFQGTKENYARGLFRYLEVLDAQRTLFELRSQYLEALARYHGARADVERLSGSLALGSESTPRRKP